MFVAGLVLAFLVGWFLGDLNRRRIHGEVLRRFITESAEEIAQAGADIELR